MTRSSTFPLALACLVCMTGACSRPAPGSSRDDAKVTGQSVAVSPNNACDLQLITAHDVANLFDKPVGASKKVTGDPQTCEFGTAGFSSVTISVRPGLGMATVAMYTSGKMDAFEKSVPLAGVGDAAVRSLLLNRIVARKGDLLCEVTGPGNPGRADDPAIHTLSALCNKIFAAY